MTPLVVVLDSTPLSLLSGPPMKKDVTAARKWRDALVMAGHRLIIPEIIDYEVRRELLRAQKPASAARLTALRGQLQYLPLATAMLERAAEIWAEARQKGRPTAGDNTIDIDMILVAQAESLRAPGAVIATANVGHLSQFFLAELWSSITP